MSTPANDYKSRQGLKPLVEVRKTIARPVAEVWSLHSSFGAIKAWMPGIDYCYVKEDGPQSPAYGATREMGLGPLVVYETLEIWDVKEHILSLRVHDVEGWPVKGIRGSHKLNVISKNETEFIWRADAAEVLGDAEQVKAQLQGLFEGSLESLKRILEG